MNRRVTKVIYVLSMPYSTSPEIVMAPLRSGMRIVGGHGTSPLVSIRLAQGARRCIA